MPALLDRPFEQTPFCVVDLETTGLSPGMDRIVEVTAIRMDPGEEPRLVLDTLVFPERRVAGTEIHGITDSDVEGAPTFAHLVPELREALSDAVMVSYNVYFDLRFLAYEFELAGAAADVPHLCAMYMRPLLTIGKRCTLKMACEDAGVDHVGVHSSAGDAIATAELMQHYAEVIRRRGAGAFRDLCGSKRYRFMRSWTKPLRSFPPASSGALKKSRLLEEDERPTASDGRWRLREYEETLLAFLDDYTISTEEAAYARELRAKLDITDEEMRAVHARIFAATLNQWAGDDRIDEAESRCLSMLRGALAALGWGPG